ncbi:MAG TPA: hypothetical protein VII92_08075, partial [Anaerolineae bacterium]
VAFRASFAKDLEKVREQRLTAAVREIINRLSKPITCKRWQTLRSYKVAQTTTAFALAIIG